MDLKSTMAVTVGVGALLVAAAGSLYYRSSDSPISKQDDTVEKQQTLEVDDPPARRRHKSSSRRRQKDHESSSKQSPDLDGSVKSENAHTRGQSIDNSKPTATSVSQLNSASISTSKRVPVKEHERTPSVSSSKRSSVPVQVITPPAPESGMPGYVVRLGRNQTRVEAEADWKDVEISGIGLEKRAAPSSTRRTIYPDVLELHDADHNVTFHTDSSSRSSSSMSANARITRLGSGRQNIQQADSSWEDVSIPASGLKLRPRTTSEMTTEISFDDTTTAAVPKAVASRTSDPFGNASVLAYQDDADSNSDISQLSIPADRPLQLAEKRYYSLGSLPSSQNWTRKPARRGKRRVPVAGSTTSTSSNPSEDESYDDISFPDTGQLQLVTAPDSEWHGLEIPNESFLHPSRLPYNRSVSRPQDQEHKHHQHHQHQQQQQQQQQNATTPNKVASQRPEISPSKQGTPLPAHLARLRSNATEHVLDSDSDGFGVELTAAKISHGVRQVHATGKELDKLETSVSRDFSPGTIHLLNKRSANTHVGSTGERTVLSREYYGNGSELDAIPDLVAPNETKLTPPPPAPPPKPIVAKQSKHSSKHKTRKAPMLIRNLNASKSAKVVGEMMYNPAKQRWDGNWNALNAFEGKPTPTRPALIANLGASVPNIVNGMVFDPVSMRWLGNEQDGDLFQDCLFSPTPEREERSSSKAIFDLSPAYKASLRAAEAAHARLVRDWDSKRNIRDHLYFIREIASKVVDG